MPGQWIPDPHARSGWRWDDAAPSADDSPTQIRNSAVVPAHQLGTPRPEVPMSYPDRSDGRYDDVVPSGPHVLDPSRGADGGGRYVQAPDTAYDPSARTSRAEPDEYSDEALVACPACGTGVHRDRIRG